jgi:hypothetical protein
MPSARAQDTATTVDPDLARICGIDYDDLAATDDLRRTCRVYRAQVARDERQREAIAMEDALKVFTDSKILNFLNKKKYILIL